MRALAGIAVRRYARDRLCERGLLPAAGSRGIGASRRTMPGRPKPTRRPSTEIQERGEPPPGDLLFFCFREATAPARLPPKAASRRSAGRQAGDIDQRGGGPMKTAAFASCIVIAAASLASPICGAAQEWPSKPVRILVPFPPGGGTDIQARLLSNAFQASTGQNFIIDNRTGGSGLIAAHLAVDSPPDGHTVLFTSGSISVVATLHARQMKFDIYKDLVPISWLTSTPLVLTVHPSVPARTVPELVELAKRHAGRMNATGNTAGSTAHLAGEMLNQVAGVDTTVLTYRGGGPAVLALISGEADYGFTTAPSIIPHLKTGRARALAVTTPKPSSALPDLPTMNTFYPGFEADNWYAMFFPKETPKAIVDRMNAEIRKALNTPELREFMAKQALDPVASSPDELTQLLRGEIRKYANVIRLAAIPTN
jgi:tripartite-type tricarboxylate transporter receptor subunit TctC